MKKFSIFGLLMLLSLGCVKQEFQKKEIRDTAYSGGVVAPYIVGKWKLLGWGTDFYEMTNCQWVGGQSYNAETAGKDVVIEILTNGKVSVFDEGLQIKSGLITSKVQNNNNTNLYYLNGGDSRILFVQLNQEENIADCQIGDTLRISNPFVNLNSNSGNVRGIAWGQAYVKIE